MTTRNIPAETADIAANWLAGLADAFEQVEFRDRYVANQAPVNAAALRDLVEVLAGASWTDADPLGGVAETRTQIMLAIADGTVPAEYQPG